MLRPDASYKLTVSAPLISAMQSAPARGVWCLFVSESEWRGGETGRLIFIFIERDGMSKSLSVPVSKGGCVCVHLFLQA